MNDDEFRDYCAAAALTGLIARSHDEEDDLRHRYYILVREAYRAAEEMVDFRREHNTRPEG